MAKQYLRFNDLKAREIVRNRTTLARWIRKYGFPPGVLLGEWEAVEENIDIARVPHNPGSDNRDLKCDLHPRWDRANRRICVDAARDGVRQCLIFDAEQVLDR